MRLGRNNTASRQVSNLRKCKQPMPAGKAVEVARQEGLEPPTSGLEGASINKNYHLDL